MLAVALLGMLRQVQLAQLLNISQFARHGQPVQAHCDVLGGLNTIWNSNEEWTDPMHMQDDRDYGLVQVANSTYIQANKLAPVQCARCKH